MRAALHIYFKKHMWKNTQLTDFISVMETAYYTLDEKPMGDDFDFKKWSDSWLKTSGVNTLTPLVTFDDAGKLSSMQIQQSFDQNGQNQLRKQQLEIAFFDEQYQPHIFKVVLNDSSELNTIEYNGMFSIKAIVMNHGDYAYDKVYFDEKTLTNLQENLY